ncbi:MAG: gamma-glutamyltransferase [Woeseiaceae bacterium]|nr:gamma-glutamyltransferase [Woeseiaceae bacterium]
MPNAYGVIGDESNEIQPGERMLSSMSPTLLLEDGAVKMVVGTPGGTTIFTSVFQAIVNVVDFGMTPAEAVGATRFPSPAAAAGPDHLQPQPALARRNDIGAGRQRLPRRAARLGIRATCRSSGTTASSSCRPRTRATAASPAIDEGLAADRRLIRRRGPADS